MYPLFFQCARVARFVAQIPFSNLSLALSANLGDLSTPCHRFGNWSTAHIDGMAVLSLPRCYSSSILLRFQFTDQQTRAIRLPFGFFSLVPSRPISLPASEKEREERWIYLDVQLLRIRSTWKTEIHTAAHARNPPEVTIYCGLCDNDRADLESPLLAHISASESPLSCNPCLQCAGAGGDSETMHVSNRANWGVSRKKSLMSVFWRHKRELFAQILLLNVCAFFVRDCKWSLRKGFLFLLSVPSHSESAHEQTQTNGHTDRVWNRP